MDTISGPWHWSFSGVMIVIVMWLLIISGKKFGVSSSFRTICAIGGAGKVVKYFDYNWKSHNWLLLFILGAILGGWISNSIIPNPHPIELSGTTLSALADLGISTDISNSLVPLDLFSFDQLFTLKGFILFIIGGFLIGFGTRWAGGCTSGHAISGLSNLQLPSLVAVIGFFIGGLTMTHFLLPVILNL